MSEAKKKWQLNSIGIAVLHSGYVTYGWILRNVTVVCTEIPTTAVNCKLNGVFLKIFFLLPHQSMVFFTQYIIILFTPQPRRYENRWKFYVRKWKKKKNPLYNWDLTFIGLRGWKKIPPWGGDVQYVCHGYFHPDTM